MFPHWILVIYNSKGYEAVWVKECVITDINTNRGIVVSAIMKGREMTLHGC